MNRNFKTGLLCLLLAGVTVAGGGCGSAESRKARALENGQRALDAGNLDKAGTEFKTALKLAPNDAQAKYLNGVLQLRLGNGLGAVELFQGALQADPKHLEARVAMARIMLVGAEPQRTVDFISAGLRDHPNDARLLAIRAAARVLLKDLAGAHADADQARNADPTNEDALAVLAGIYRLEGKTDKAQLVLEAAVTEHSRSVDLRLALAQLDIALHEDARAEALLREIVQLRPRDRAQRVRLAQFLSRKGRTDEAEKELRAGVAAVPEDRELKAVLVDFIRQTHGVAAAASALEAMVAAAPGDYTQRFMLARVYTEAGEPAKAVSIYREVIAKEGTRPAGLDARVRLARHLLLRNEPQSAEPLLAEVLASSPHDPDVILLRAELALAKGDVDAALGDLQGLLRTKPSAAAALRVMARAYVIKGDPAQAEDALRRALVADPADAGVRVDLANFLIESGRPEQAKPIVEELAKARPADITAQQALFVASAATKDYVTARAAALSLRAIDPHSALGWFDLGQVAEAQGQFGEAVEQYRAALQAQPGAADPLASLTRVLLRQKRTADALHALDEAATRSPESALPLSLKADVLLSEHRIAEADVAAAEALRRAPKSALAYRTLASLAAAKGGRGAQIAVLSGAIDKVEDPSDLRALLAGLYEQAGQREAAGEQYEAILKARPRQPFAANNLAMLLASQGSDTAGLARAAELVAPFAISSNPVFLDTFGWVKLKLGDAPTALAALQKAHAGLPAVAEISYHLGLAQIAAGQSASGAESLRAALTGGAKMPWEADAKAALAKLASSAR